MPDIDDIIDRLLSDRRIQEGAAFSTRSYTDQPIIERGSDLKARMERRNAEHAAKRQREAKARASQREAKASTYAKAETIDERHDTRTRPTATASFAELLFGKTPLSMFGKGAHAAQAPAAGEPLPERIREMRRLESGRMPASLAHGSSAVSSLFCRQALLMADYEDDYEFHGSFSQYYPTYAAMSDHQLRGYFSWRTRVRQGHVEAAPLSFAFVHVYELLCGVGTHPGAKGLADLRAFGEAYRQADERQGATLLNYLRRWEADYVIYHQLYDEMPTSDARSLPAAVLTLLTMEHALLRQAGDAPRIENEAATGPVPAPERLLQALSDAATYHLIDSRLAKSEPELVRNVACDVFASLVAHCAKRRKTDFVEGLFGYATRTPYTMFSAAVFHEDVPHDDCSVRVSDAERYVCKDGRWTRLCAVDAHARNADLGLVLHTIDFELRQQLDFAYPLKERVAPKYLQKMVRDAIARRLAERAEAERRRITIDRSKLRGIRAAAALTQESLLTEDERTENPVTSAPATVSVSQPQSQPAQAHITAPAPEAPAPAVPAPTPPAASAPAPIAPAPPPAVSPSSEEGLLSPLERRFVEGLLAQVPVAQLLGPTDPFPSVVADTINEKFFDLVGDAVIEFEGDEPHIIEDYLEDVREVLSS